MNNSSSNKRCLMMIAVQRDGTLSNGFLQADKQEKGIDKGLSIVASSLDK